MKRIIVGFFCVASVGMAYAATLYRWVNPEGVVTYQNSPPPPSVGHVKVMHVDGHNSATSMRQALAAMHPVVLYKAPHCTPCKQVSDYLHKRRVPFKVVDVSANRAALVAMKKRTGATTVPTIMVGHHVLIGYIPAALKAELTAAGYPRAPKT